MAGMFELFIDAEDSFRFQLTVPDGTVQELATAPVDRFLGSRPHAAVRPVSMRMPLQCQKMAG